jgi:hypothetical protein
MEMWASRREERNPLRTVCCTRRWITQKLQANRMANGVKDQRKARVAKRILTVSPARQLRLHRAG